MTMTDWREGDVFFWRYQNELGSQTDKYWCCAKKAIVRGVFLGDIYWSHIDGHTVSFHSGSRWWSRADAENLLTLDFKGNLNEFDVIADYDRSMYDDLDILDLRHSNSSQKQVYLRKGAKRSRAAMLAKVNYKIEKAESEIRSENREIERLYKEKAKIEAGELEGVWL